MTAVSATIEINNTTFDTIENLASITMTEGKTYSIQAQNNIELKIAGAIFPISDKNGIGTLTQGEDSVYIRTPGIPATFTILENA